LATEDFFKKLNKPSIIKSEIVSKYFSAWSNVIFHAQKKGYGHNKANKIGYIDLFAGQGKDECGQDSTPLLIVKNAIKNEYLQQSLVTVFNDSDPNKLAKLRNSIFSLEGVNLLKHNPMFDNVIVGDELANKFGEIEFIPTLFFVDPWGYKGLSRRLFKSILKDWGCDFIFFFNYRRINAALNNNLLFRNMENLFGTDRAINLSSKLKEFTPIKRHEIVIDEIKDALEEIGGEFILPFKFLNKTGKAITHHLIFVSKHPLGYSIMKDIMAKYSLQTLDGIIYFEYNPAIPGNRVLFHPEYSLDRLCADLKEIYRGQSILMDKIYEDHHCGKNYIKKNYKDAIRNLEEQGEVRIKRPTKRAQIRGGKMTISDQAFIEFLN
jgi:three-Cys-motif partner protein